MDIERCARTARLVALLGFVLPWLTVSCAGQPVMRVSGIGIVAGKAVISNPITGVSNFHSQNPDLILLMAFILILSLSVSYYIIKKTSNPSTNMYLSGGALGMIALDIFVKADKMPNSPDFNGFAGYNFQVNTSYGFWLTCAALALATVLDYRMGMNCKTAIEKIVEKGPSIWE